MKRVVNQTIDYLNHMNNGKKVNTEKLMDIVTLIKEQKKYAIEDIPEMIINQNISLQDFKEPLVRAVRSELEILNINDIQKKRALENYNVKIYLKDMNYDTLGLFQKEHNQN